MLKAVEAERDELLEKTKKQLVEITELNKKVIELEAEIKRLKEQLSKLGLTDPLERYLAETAAERRRILETLQNELKVDFPELKVVISQESDALRFEGDGLFNSGSSDLRADRRAIVEKIASRLDQLLPCYTLGERARWSAACNLGFSVIEAVQIEGHTDSVGSENSNLVLSTARANTTFMAMTAKEPGLTEHLNVRKQPVLSVAGYGEMRPVTDNNSSEGRATNRRIDLRIIMYTPAKSEEIDKIRNILNAADAQDNGRVQ
ncbi:OmpA/MotB family protein [Neopusillimonas aromaticivorans]|uniref:OmpA/MotB family protein n=1 Tax=Neopusillimonas aromaticivorans TaxID=2979868 RepID=UPI00259AB806|nr:OmpA family protein [Neopusillimonas aromaticivorans]WJJ93802.1 OmpA family protein [Neopusillimonas aromaticivorans]